MNGLEKAAYGRGIATLTRTDAKTWPSALPFADRLRGSAAAISLLAGASAVVGVLLPDPARAQVTLSSGDTTNNTYTIPSIESIFAGSTSPVLIAPAGTNWTIANSGTIQGFNFGGSPGGSTNDWAIQFQGSGGTLINNAGAYIAGYVGVAMSGAGSITNAGTITGAGGTGTGSVGVTLANGGTITNATGALITGHATGIQESGTAVIDNSGTITGSTRYGILLAAGGTVTNSAGARITGQYDGIRSTSGTVTVTNSGTILAQAANSVGVDLIAGGSVANMGTASLISGGSGGVILGVPTGAGTVTNQGTILGGRGFGVYIGRSGGSVTNSGTASTISGSYGVAIFGTGVVVNQGSVISTKATRAGLYIYGNGTLTNSGTLATVSGGGNGVQFENGTGTITNAGTVVGHNGSGILLTSGGSITNSAGAVIQGTTDGIKTTGGTTTISNAGTITATGATGVALASNAVLTNQTSGTISGVDGVLFTGTGASLTNAGTITGSSGVAVQFDAGVNTLTLATGSVLNGSIDGGGGSGQITLTGSGALSSAITNFGAGSALSIANGADWSANGGWTIATVTNAGRLTAGSQSAPLTLTGNFTQTSSGTLVLSVGSITPFRIIGTATLAGSLNATVASNSLLLPGTTYTLLTASGGVSGSFSSVTTDSALLSTAVSYGADDVTMTTTAQSVATGAATPNQRAVATALDRANASNPNAFSTIVLGLDQLNTPQLHSTLNRLSGEGHANLTSQAIATGTHFLNAIQGQLAQPIPGIAGGAGLSGRRADLGGFDGGDGGDDTSPAIEPQPWSVWTSGYGQTTHMGSSANGYRLNQTISSGALGTDYRIDPDLLVGIGLGYGHTDGSVSEGAGKEGLDHTMLGVYGLYAPSRVYVNGVLGVTYGSGSSKRDASVPGTPAWAYADLSDFQLLGSIETGYSVALGQMSTLTPLAGLSVGTVWQNGFTEHGAGALDLAVRSQTETSVRSVTGIRLDHIQPLGSRQLAMDLRIGWDHDLTGTTHNSVASFQNVSDASFTVDGIRTPRDSADVGFGVATSVGRGVSVYLHYDGQFGGIFSNAATGGLRYTW